MKKYNLSSLKTTCLILGLLLFAVSHNSLASGEHTDKALKKSKVVNKESFLINKTDTLKSLSKVNIHQKDSLSSYEKTNMNSGASYNILFQVIYRNSFSEIFEEKK